MKYLKIFENFNGYYQKISEMEYIHIIYPRGSTEICGNLVPFTNTEISKIELLMISPITKTSRKYMVSKRSDGELLIIDDKSTDTVDAFPELKYSVGRSKLFLPTITIYKFPDEWYVISISVDKYLYYKCDQFDGLVEFITNKPWINGSNL